MMLKLHRNVIAVPFYEIRSSISLSTRIKLFLTQREEIYPYNWSHSLFTKDPQIETNVLNHNERILVLNAKLRYFQCDTDDQVSR